MSLGRTTKSQDIYVTTEASLDLSLALFAARHSRHDGEKEANLRCRLASFGALSKESGGKEEPFFIS